MNNFLKKNKFTVFALVFLILLFILIISAKQLLFPNIGSAIYGNRLNGIVEVKKDYKEGVMLSVNKDYIVKAQNSGIVVFIGEKEGYGNSVIIQQVDGVDLMYGNLENINISLYDYIKKDEIIGDVNGKLYLVYKKEGKIIDYEEYNKG